MDTRATATWDGTSGTAGGAAFGEALRKLAAERQLDAAAIAEAAGIRAELVDDVFAGTERLTVAQLARLAQALRLKAIEFMQKSSLLSLSVYALGLDPLFFLPDGGVRHDARIYMREINPRHAVPEKDMLVRNPVLKAVMDDTVLDPLGKLEVELCYLLRAATQGTGGSL